MIARPNRRAELVIGPATSGRTRWRGSPSPLRREAAKTISPERYAARFAAERAKLVRAYCDLFGFWRRCSLKRCRKLRRCGGDAAACLKRRASEVPRGAQWQARQRVIAATPASAGPPERTARESMPAELLYEPRQSEAGCDTRRAV